MHPNIASSRKVLRGVRSKRRVQKQLSADSTGGSSHEIGSKHDDENSSTQRDGNDNKTSDGSGNVYTGSSKKKFRTSTSAGRQQVTQKGTGLRASDGDKPQPEMTQNDQSASTTAIGHASHSATSARDLHRIESQEAAYLNQSSGGESTGGGDFEYGQQGARANSGSTFNADDLIENDGSPSDERQASSCVPSAPVGLTKNLVYAVFASAVGSSFQHGYNGGVVNAPAKLIGEFINETYQKRHGEPASDAKIDLIFAVIVSIFCVGGCIGALMTALIADRFGRREGLIYNNLLVLVASPMMASARSMSSYELLIIGRLLIGINAGLNAGLAPLYLNEIAPVQLRGALGTVYQLVITISILLSNIFGLPSLLGDQESWPILFALPIIPAAFMLTALPHCCESPKHLLLNEGRELQAQQAFAWLRQTSDVQEEIEDLRNERELNSLQSGPMTLYNMVHDTSLSRPLTIAIVIMLSQQFSGINAVLFYSTSIFRDAGLSEASAVNATLGMSATNVIMTLVSLFLVDRAGRRTLHMTGLMGMAATCLVLALCLEGSANGSHVSSVLAVVSVYVFVAMFACGPGSIPWFLVAELFPSNARPLVSSITVAVNWMANFTVLLGFLPLANILHGYTFVLFAILLVIFYLFTYYRVPETRGATSEEISAFFKS